MKAGKPSATDTEVRQVEGSSLPQQEPSGIKNLTLEGKLPVPRKRVKKLVQLRAPITVAPDSSDEVSSSEFPLPQ